MNLSALGQEGLPYTIPAEPDSQYFGALVASGGDANNDGSDDIFVFDKAADGGSHPDRWFVYSGSDGSLLWSGVSTEDNYPLGTVACHFVNDLDGDDCDEIVLGRSALLGGRGGVDVFSGRTGDVLFSYRGESATDGLGRDIDGVGDVDGNGHPDFAFVGRYAEDGFVSVRSGVDGEEILRVLSVEPRRVRGIGDVDHDDRDDLVVGLWGNRPRIAEVHIISGRTGEVLHLISAPDPFNERFFAYELAAGRDVTGDGVGDVLAMGGDIPEGHAYLYSGATGDLVTTILEPATGGEPGLYGCNIEFGDFDGDGASEAIISTADRVFVTELPSGRAVNVRDASDDRPTGYGGHEFVVGDVNGDGLDDIVMGFPARQPVGGRVTAESGGNLLLGRRILQPSVRNQFIRGHRYNLQVAGGLAGRTIHLLGSISGHGCTFVPQLGICIDLDRQIFVLGDAIVDGEGFASLQLTIPMRVPLGPAWMQALDINDPQRGPITSNVMEIEIQNP